jgi:hypothetical protein
MSLKRVMVTPNHSIADIARMGVQIGSLIESLNVSKKSPRSKKNGKKRK